MRLVSFLALALAGCFLSTVPEGYASDDGSSTSGSVSSSTTFPGTTTTSTSTSSSTTGSGSTDESTSASTVATADDDGGTFIVFSDGGPICHCDCDVITQDCPRGEKCMPWANDGGNVWNATKCTPLDANAGKPGDPCTVEGSPVSGIDTCDLTSMCFYVDPDTNIGVCVPFCVDVFPPTCSAADDCTVCVVANDGVLPLCLPACDPLLQDCGDGRSCHLVAGDFVCIPDQSGSGALGETCEGESACDPGLLCVDAMAIPGCAGELGCCAALCDTAAADPCPGAPMGTTCSALWLPGDEPQHGCTPPTLGVCVPP